MRLEEGRGDRVNPVSRFHLYLTVEDVSEGTQKASSVVAQRGCGKAPAVRLM